MTSGNKRRRGPFRYICFVRRRKTLIWIFAVIGGLGLCLWVMSKTYVLTVFTIPTSANEPTLFVGDHVWASRLKSPEQHHLVFFYRHDKLAQAGDVGCYRLVAKAGQTVELRNSIAYVDGKLVDDSTQLSFPYLFKAEVFVVPEELKKYDHPEIAPGTLMVYVPPGYATTLSKDYTITPMRNTKGLGDERLAEPFRGKHWNRDWLGPVTVPPGKVFLLGDSRCNAFDSRFTGFIDEHDLIGGVIGY